MKALLKTLKRNIDQGFRAFTMLLGTLVGVKRIGKEEYDLHQVYVITAFFFFGAPFIVAIFGWTTLSTWLAFMLMSVAVINIDEFLMLSYMISEYGVNEVLNYQGDYREWIRKEQSYYMSSMDLSP